MPKYNVVIAPKDVGRPLEASEKQCADVLKLRKSGMSLRKIRDETNLGLNTVRTIIGRRDGTDRATRKRLERINPDRAQEQSWKSKERLRNALPKQINESLKVGAALAKEVKGLA